MTLLLFLFFILSRPFFFGSFFVLGLHSLVSIGKEALFNSNDLALGESSLFLQPTPRFLHVCKVHCVVPNRIIQLSVSRVSPISSLSVTVA